MTTTDTEERSAYELERGKPVPSYNHSKVQMRLGVEFSRSGPGFDILSELRLIIRGKPYYPDLCLFPKRPKDWLHDVVEMADPPLMAVEILSPTQGFNTVSAKLDIYFEHGVGTVWVVHPEIQTITIFSSLTEQQRFTDGIARDPKTGVTADLAEVFG